MTSAPASPAPSGGALAWPALVDAVSKAKISLGAALGRARGEAKADGGYLIRFAKPFDRDSAQRASAVIEAELARLAGRPVPLELALGAPEPEEPTEIVDPGVPAPSAGAAAPPGTRWKEIGAGGGDAGRAGGLKSAEGVFGGKARIVKKPPTSA